MLSLITSSMSSKRTRPTIFTETSYKGNGVTAVEEEIEGKTGNGKHTKFVTASKKENRKRASPFRIKPGCIVALRFRSDVSKTVEVTRSSDKLTTDDVESLNFDDNFMRAWVDPVPGRDERLALIGKRIRCFFSNVEGKSRRVLEGEVVSLIDYKATKSFYPFNAELLVDKSLLDSFQFLVRTDNDVDISKLPNETARRNHNVEERIRGKNKATVKVTLENPACFGARAGDAARWVILKRIPPKLFRKHCDPKVPKRKSACDNESSINAAESSQKHITTTSVEIRTTSLKQLSPDASVSKPNKVQRNDSASSGLVKSAPVSVMTRYCGDGNDEIEQQKTNWRWLASRYYDMEVSSALSGTFRQKSSTSSSFIENIVTGGLVGRVMGITSSNSGETMAFVTIQRLILPEQTISGRLPNHHVSEIFEDYDSSFAQSGANIEFRLPVEQLVIVSRIPPVCKSYDIDESDQLILKQSYSMHMDLYFSINSFKASPETVSTSSCADPQSTAQFCHRCRTYIENLEVCPRARACLLYCPGLGPARWCNDCIRALNLGANNEKKIDLDTMSELPCCLATCDCRRCSLSLGFLSQVNLMESVTRAVKSDSDSMLFKTPIQFAASFMQRCDVTDFSLPPEFCAIQTIPLPQSKIITKVRPRKVKRLQSHKLGRGKKYSDKNHANIERGTVQRDELIVQEDYSIFKPTCARAEFFYEKMTKVRKKTDNNSSLVGCGDVIRNIREYMSNNLRTTSRVSDRDNERVSNSRAARANQRRLMKDVASFGASTSSSLGLLDSLANREPQLRFDRSSIHAFGVFADADIATDEMIVEYRGELIANAMAEKREMEYEAAKIGSDYMFRIDADVVCDATKQGNVARFINASCDPNCYTKIIPLDGTKRIVIYAKREITAGEELCYDYKFPIEYDETKWIPCHCGARECRGYMNWDKRYIAISETSREN